MHRCSIYSTNKDLYKCLLAENRSKATQHISTTTQRLLLLLLSTQDNWNLNLLTSMTFAQSLMNLKLPPVDLQIFSALRHLKQKEFACFKLFHRLVTNFSFLFFFFGGEWKISGQDEWKWDSMSLSLFSLLNYRELMKILYIMHVSYLP